MKKTDILKRLIVIPRMNDHLDGIINDLWEDLDKMACIGEASIQKLDDAYDRGYQDALRAGCQPVSISNYHASEFEEVKDKEPEQQ